MFWLAEKDFSRIVPLTWRRVASSGEWVSDVEPPPSGEWSPSVEPASDVESSPSGKLPSSVESQTSVEEDVVSRMGTWTQKGQAHYVAFDDTGEGGADATSTGEPSSRTILRVEPTKVSLMRFGEVRWNHTFEVHRVGKSTLTMAGFAIDVEAKPTRLDVEVHPGGGVLRIDYDMTLASIVQHVELTLRFGEEVSVGGRDEG